MPRTKKDVVTEFRTAEILQAAHHVFAERGYELATMDEIARVAGVAKGTLYLYYPSKQEIYAAALHRSAEELAARTAAAVEQAGPIEEKLRAFFDTKLRYFEEHRDFFRLYDCEVGRFVRHGHKGRQFDELLLEQVRLIDRILQQAVRRRTIRPVRTEAVAFAILNITRGLVMQRLRGATKASIDDDIAFAFELTWKGIGHR